MGHSAWVNSNGVLIPSDNRFLGGEQLLHPGIEDWDLAHFANPTGYAVFGVPYQETSIIHGGTYALRMTRPPSGPNQLWQVSSGSHDLGIIDDIPYGRTGICGAWWYIPTGASFGTGQIRMYLRALSGDGAEFYFSPDGTWVAGPSITWAQSFTFPGSGVWMNCQLGFHTSAPYKARGAQLSMLFESENSTGPSEGITDDWSMKLIS